MSFSRMAVSLMLCLAVSSTALQPAARGQPQQRIDLDITQFAESGGGVSYEIEMQRIFGGRGSLIAPDGTLFDTPPGAKTSVAGLSFSQLASRFFGTWTIRDVPFPPRSPSDYEFAFSPFILGHVFTETPIITSPPDGAVLPPSFSVDWDFRSGAMPGSRLVSYSLPHADVDVDFAPNGVFSAHFDIDLRGQGPTRMTIRAGTTSQLAMGIGPVTLVSGSGTSQFTISSRFKNLSLPIIVDVVPEPSSLGLLMSAVGVIAGTVRLRLGRRSRQPSALAVCPSSGSS